MLNFSLRQVLTDEADQRGSLVAPDRMRFDYTAKSGLTAEQVKRIEIIAREMISRNEPVYAQVAPLSEAKSVKGLRSMFDEVCDRLPVSFFINSINHKIG